MSNKRNKSKYYKSDSSSEDNGKFGSTIGYLLGLNDKNNSYSSDEASEDEYFPKKTKFGCHGDNHGHSHSGSHSGSHSDSSSGSCDTSSGSSVEEEMTQHAGHGHHGHHGGSHSSHHGHSTFMKQSKKYQNTSPAPELKLQKIVYDFNVLTDTKSKKDLVIKSSDLKIKSAPRNHNQNDLSSKKIFERASQNSDIVTKCYLTLQTNFDGPIQIQFPNIKCVDGTMCFNEDFMSITADNLNNKKKNEPFEIINRKLTRSQKEFLTTYPGQTQENFKDLCSKTPGKNSIVQVGLQPVSCLTHYFDKLQKPSYFKEYQNYIEVPVTFYNKLVKFANEDFSHNYAFSDVTSSSFEIRIKPLINTTIQKRLDDEIQELQIQKKKLDNKNKTDKNLNEKLKFLTATGFSNFYTTNVVDLSNQEMAKKYETFEKGINYKFHGTLTIEYFQVQVQKRIEMKKKYK
jgi:hypothetical protein